MAFHNPDMTGILYDPSDWRPALIQLINEFNGRIDNSNISSTANILTSKLNAPTVNGVLVGGTTATAAVTQVSPGSSGNVLQSNGTTWTSAAASTGSVTLLRALSGTSTAAVATNVDTFAISGLTSKDSLLILYNISSSTSQTALVTIYQSTDGVIFSRLNSGNAIPANQHNAGQVILRQDQTGVNTVDGSSQETNDSAASVISGVYTQSGPTQAWTGSFNLSLRHSGVTAGGTFVYSWSVYKVAGQ